MAPSSRISALKRQAQPAIKSNVFRVTKSARINLQPEVSKQKAQAIQGVIFPKEQVHIKQDSKKRRRDPTDSDCDDVEITTRSRKPLKKARQTSPSTRTDTLDHRQRSNLQLPTPSPSPKSECQPAALEELESLHKIFTQTLAVQYAHNGSRSSLSLADVLPTMTRLWKRRAIHLQDIQRMLGLWELDEETQQHEPEIEHNKGPFRLVRCGMGSSTQMKLEYTWTELGRSMESELHQRFQNLIKKIHKWRETNRDKFSLDSLAAFPLLKCHTGAQTQMRREKVALIRDQILKTPAQKVPAALPQSLDLSKLDISEEAGPKPSLREATLKSRTLSLFDRLQAKQIANSTSATPTSAELLRRRALHRIPDIVSILRLKQARRLNSQFQADILDSPSRMSARSMKVSFSLDAIVQEIRDSEKASIAIDEVRECISILGREIPDTWCNIYTSGQAKCVTLQGEGWRKEEIRDWCEREISKMGSA